MGNRFGRLLVSTFVVVLGASIGLIPFLFLNGCGNGPGSPIQQRAEQVIITFTLPGAGSVTGVATNTYNGATMSVTFSGASVASVTSTGMSVYPGSIGSMSATFDPAGGPLTFNYTIGARAVTSAALTNLSPPYVFTVSQTFP